MGIPQHYSLELPERCFHLIKELLPAVSNVRMPSSPHLGPLTTTFLLALSTPIITVPIERVMKHRNAERDGHEGYADDRPLSAALARAVDAGLGDNPLRASPFYTEGAWRFAAIPFEAGFNIARHFPNNLSNALADDEAIESAAELSAFEWARLLRNSIGHGGISYLDSEGHQSHGQPTEMLAFVSAKYPGGNFRLPPESLVALRIRREDYLTFLGRWVDWLHQSRLTLHLAA